MRVAYRIIKATRTHTQRNMSYLLLFHGNNSFINEPHCYILRTLPLLLNYCFKFRLKTKEPVLWKSSYLGIQSTSGISLFPCLFITATCILQNGRWVCYPCLNASRARGVKLKTEFYGDDCCKTMCRYKEQSVASRTCMSHDLLLKR